VVATGGPNVQSYNHSVEVTEDSAVVLTYYDDATTSPGDGVATTDVWLRHSHSGGATWEPEQHLHGPFDHYDAPISFFAPGDPRGCSSATTETIAGNDVINFFTSTISDGADVHSIRATTRRASPEHRHLGIHTLLAHAFLHVAQTRSAGA
jgi:hypothetical protein